jgi:hypothetical protein
MSQAFGMKSRPSSLLVRPEVVENNNSSDTTASLIKCLFVRMSCGAEAALPGAKRHQLDFVDGNDAHHLDVSARGLCDIEYRYATVSRIPAKDF